MTARTMVSIPMVWIAATAGTNQIAVHISVLVLTISLMFSGVVIHSRLRPAARRDAGWELMLLSKGEDTLRVSF